MQSLLQTFIVDLKMSTGWSNEETIALLGVWGAAAVQSQQDDVSITGMCTEGCICTG